MKKIMSMLTIIAILGISTATFAGESGSLGKRYYSPALLLHEVADSEDDAFSIGIDGNFPIHENIDLSVQGEFAFFDGKILGTDTKIDQQTIGSSLKYHFPTDTIITPYVGAGIGIVFINTTETYFEEGNPSVFKESFSTTDFIYHGNIGVEIEPANKTLISLDYILNVIESTSFSSISTDVSYWFTPKFSVSLDARYDFDGDSGVNAYGISANFLF